jgi:hypothetical protein
MISNSAKRSDFGSYGCVRASGRIHPVHAPRLAAGQAPIGSDVLRHEASFALSAGPVVSQPPSHAAAAAGAGQAGKQRRMQRAATAVLHTAEARRDTEERAAGPEGRVQTVPGVGGKVYRRRTAELIRELDGLLGPHRGGVGRGGAGRGVGRARNVVLRQVVELAQALLRDKEVLLLLLVFAKYFGCYQ